MEMRFLDQRLKMPGMLWCPMSGGATTCESPCSSWSACVASAVTPRYYLMWVKWNDEGGSKNILNFMIWWWWCTEKKYCFNTYILYFLIFVWDFRLKRWWSTCVATTLFRPWKSFCLSCSRLTRSTLWFYTVIILPFIVSLPATKAPPLRQVSRIAELVHDVRYILSGLLNWKLQLSYLMFRHHLQQ